MEVRGIALAAMGSLSDARFEGAGDSSPVSSGAVGAGSKPGSHWMLAASVGSLLFAAPEFTPDGCGWTDVGVETFCWLLIDFMLPVLKPLLVSRKRPWRTKEK